MTKNRYYNYDHIDLWNGEKWKHRLSCTFPLVRWIQTEGHARFRGREKGACKTDWKDSRFNSHTYSTEYPELLAEWEAKGLQYSSSRMGVTRWIAMAPTTVWDKSIPEPDIIVIPVTDADYTDKNWAMDTLEYNKDYIDWAAKEKKLLIFVVTDGVDIDDMYVSILNEVAAIFHIGMKKILFDVSLVYEIGKTLKDIPDFTFTDISGNVISDPDTVVTKISPLQIPVLDITDIWVHKDSLLQSLMTREENHNTLYSLDDFVHSRAGKRMAEAIALEYEFDDVKDPAYSKVWNDIGLKLDLHRTANEQWVTLVPKSALENPDEKLPIILLLQEVPEANPHIPITSISYNYGWTDIAAQGDCILLLFALETPQDNDLLSDILKEAAKIYPVDLGRVFITGHSHNCWYVNEFLRRHPGEITGAATLGVSPGFVDPKTDGGRYTDEFVDDLSKVDTAIIHVVGYAEHSCHVPINCDAPFLTEWEKAKSQSRMHEFEVRANAWQRRLKSTNCPICSIDEIKATVNSDDYVERKLGIPSDKTECLYMDGFENYIADIKNNEGKYHLRVVAMDNMPHTVTPLMVELCWSYLRRFSRDHETGKIIELY